MSAAPAPSTEEVIALSPFTNNDPKGISKGIKDLKRGQVT
jgi:hypothetical protein